MNRKALTWDLGTKELKMSSRVWIINGLTYWMRMWQNYLVQCVSFNGIFEERKILNMQFLKMVPWERRQFFFVKTSNHILKLLFSKNEHHELDHWQVTIYFFYFQTLEGLWEFHQLLSLPFPRIDWRLTKKLEECSSMEIQVFTLYFQQCWKHHGTQRIEQKSSLVSVEESNGNSMLMAKGQEEKQQNPE